MPPDSRADGPCGPKARRTRGPASPGQRTAQPFGGTLNASPLLYAGGIGLPRAFGDPRGPPHTRGIGPRGGSAAHAARRPRGASVLAAHASRRPRARPHPPASRLAASAPAWYTVRNPCTKEDATDDRFPALPASAPPHGHAAGVGAVDLRAVSAAGRDLAGHRAQRLCHLSRLVGRAGLLAQSFHLGRRGPAHRLQRPAGGVRPRGHAGRARLYGGDALRLVCQALRAELSYHRHL